MKSFQDILAEMKARRVKARTSANGCRAHFIKIFCSLMISRVLITFCGSGDSGSIEDIEITYADLKHTLPDAQENQLCDELREWAYKYLEGTGVDWYNNEGGQGEIEFDMRSAPFAFRANVDQNEMTSETKFQTEEVL